MTPIDCSWEDDVLAAIGSGRWPDRVDADLRDHVAQCAICQDVVSVAGAFAEACDAPPAAVTVPESAVVWWRAQIRAREEATRLAARPITVAQAISFASIIGLLGMIVGATSSWLQTGMHWLGGMASRLDPRGMTVPASLVTVVTDHTMLIGAVGACLLAMTIGIYLTIREN